MDAIPAVENVDNEAAVANDTTYESLDIVVCMIRNDQKLSFQFASSMPILRVENEQFHKRIQSRFLEEVIYFDRSFRSNKPLIDLTIRKPCIYHIHQSLKFLNDMIKSEGYNPKIHPAINVEEDYLPFDMCSRLGKM